MVKYTLHYFNGRGLAESIRMIFAYKGIEFEDHRHEFSDFKKDQVDGKKLPESFAILRYLAKQNGLAGKTDFDAAEIDAIAYLWKGKEDKQNFMTAYFPYVMVLTGRKEGDKDKLRKEALLPALEQYIPILERLLKESGNGFFHKSGLSFADFFAASMFYNAQKFMGDDFNKYKTLIEHSERIHSLPKVKEYVAKRPDSQF
ncbi:hypothetical protein M3Y96_00316800 [Aphelenchoides besseyi]|nr:hypothetical protein M3Y96_00316800 [Aphelenchoides besseyi]